MAVVAKTFPLIVTVSHMYGHLVLSLYSLQHDKGTSLQLDLAGCSVIQKRHYQSSLRCMLSNFVLILYAFVLLKQSVVKVNSPMHEYACRVKMKRMIFKTAWEFSFMTHAGMNGLFRLNPSPHFANVLVQFPVPVHHITQGWYPKHSICQDREKPV